MFSASSSEGENEEEEVFRPGKLGSSKRSVNEDSSEDSADSADSAVSEDSEDYSSSSSSSSESEEEVYGKRKVVVKKKRNYRNDSDSEEDWRTSKKKNKNQNKNKNKSRVKAKATSGIVSDESEEESSDENDEFGSLKRKKKSVSSGEIEFRQDWSDPKVRLVDSIGDWNEVKDEFLVKWRGRSWNWATWLPSNSSELTSVKRKLENFVKKIEEERSDNEEGFSAFLETMRYNLLENWRVVERVISSTETAEQGRFYLCKWRALGYSESTWEWEGDIRGFSEDASVKVDEFLGRQYGSGSGSGLKKCTKGSRNFRRYKEQPEFIQNDLKLRDYQLDGLNWLLFSWCRRVNVILADEMGLGKTIQSVCFLKALKLDYGTPGPTLLVVPLSTIDAWQREFGLWAGKELNVIVYMGDADSRATARKYEFPGGFDVLLTTYELILKDQAILSTVKWKLLLVDEGHRLKNSASQLYDVLFSLVPASGRVLITGTPLQNSLGELWCLLRFLMPEKFSDYEDFLQKYSVDMAGSGAGAAGGGTGANDNARLDELHALIKPHILRRLKRDVEHSLPGKSEKIIRVDLTPLQKQLYRYILTRNYRDLKRTQEAAGNRAVGGLLNILGELKKICNHPLLLGTGSPALKEFASDGGSVSFKSEESGKLQILQRLLRRLKDDGHRVLIFSQSVRMLDLLQSFVKSEGYAWQRLDGSTTSVARHLAITAFNAPSSGDFLFLLSTRAGGLGINLATADTVIIYDSDWNPQNDLQAMARAHRIGQKKTVKIFRLVSAGTVEEEILERAKRKMVLDHLVIQQLKGNGKKSSSTSGDLQAILKFGAKSLFDSEKPGISAAAMDLEAIFADDPIAAEETSQEGGNADDEEFLGQFRIADLGTLGPNWDEIIPEADRIKAEEAERQAEELSKEVELQEALLTAATRRSRMTVNKSVDNQKQPDAEQPTSKSAKNNAASSDDLILFAAAPPPESSGLDWDAAAVKSYDSLSRFGLVESEKWGERMISRLEALVAGSADDPAALPCHFRVVPSAPLQKASLPGLLERIKGLKALQGSLTAYRGRNGDDAELVGFRHSILGVKAPSSWPFPSYSVQQDSALLVAVGRLGFGSWQGIRQELSEKNSSAWSKLQGPQITRRVDYLLKELLANKEKLSGSGSGSSSSSGGGKRSLKPPSKPHSKPPSKTHGNPSDEASTNEMRIIEKFRRPFKPLRPSLLALESLKSADTPKSADLGSVLSEHLKRLGDFIDADDQLRSDPEAWEFIGCFWPFQKGSTGPELRNLYKSL